MAAKVALSWPGGTTKELQSNIGAVDVRMQRVIGGLFLYAEGEGTDYMKENAPWTDRTGNARAGLHAYVPPSGGEDNDIFELIFAHSMYYGVFLELANSGRYSIIAQTVQHFGDLLMQRISRAFNKVEQVES